jgi:hypothetical protein
VVLLSDHPEAKVKPFVRWLETQGSPAPLISREKLSSPTHLGEIYQAASRVCEKVIGDRRASNLKYMRAFAQAWPDLANSLLDKSPGARIWSF